MRIYLRLYYIEDYHVRRIYHSKHPKHGLTHDKRRTESCTKVSEYGEPRDKPEMVQRSGIIWNDVVLRVKVSYPNHENK